MVSASAVSETQNGCIGQDSNPTMTAVPGPGNKTLRCPGCPGCSHVSVKHWSGITTATTTTTINKIGKCDRRRGGGFGKRSKQRETFSKTSRFIQQTPCPNRIVTKSHDRLGCVHSGGHTLHHRRKAAPHLSPQPPPQQAQPPQAPPQPPPLSLNRIITKTHYHLDCVHSGGQTVHHRTQRPR